MTDVARYEGGAIVMPGLVTAHSHAFQRGLRARTQRARAGSFWSWRSLMYQFASRLDPESIYALSRFAYAELALNGVTAVGEFHYVHHQPDGSAYDDRIAMADAVVRAARDVGLRITLLRVVYERPGWGRSLEDAQRRFRDVGVEHALTDAEAIATRFADDPGVNVGLAPHSVRAVRAESLRAIAEHAGQHGWPLHMHVGEQRREVQECLAEHGVRPVELLSDSGVLSPRFVAVHATHLTRNERALLEGSFACICRTTERDLGDGAPALRELDDAGVKFCVGVDSHACSDPFVELRALELDERVRTEARTVVADGTRLLEIGTRGDPLGIVNDSRLELDADDPALVGTHPVDDAVAFAASARAVRTVAVGERTIVQEGQLPDWNVIRESYVKTVRALAQ